MINLCTLLSDHDSRIMESVYNLGDFLCFMLCRLDTTDPSEARTPGWSHPQTAATVRGCPSSTDTHAAAPEQQHGHAPPLSRTEHASSDTLFRTLWGPVH